MPDAFSTRNDIYPNILAIDIASIYTLTYLTHPDISP
jgi:hypothetical protein